MLRNIKQKLLDSVFIQLSLISVIIIASGLFFRCYPATRNLDKPNQLAYKHLVYLNLKKDIDSKLRSAYPTMPPEIRSKMANMQVNKLADSNANNIQEIADSLKRRSTKDLFNFYLLGSDSYYYYHLTKKILNTGSVSKTIRGGKYFEPLMMAPLGHWRILEIHPYIGALFYKVISLFNKTISLMMALSLIPLILYSLTVITFVYICTRMKFNKLVILISGIFFSLSPIFLQRSSIGWYDTDPYNVLFLLLSILLLSSINIATKAYKKITLLALLSGLYSLIWQGWLFLPITILTVLVISSFSRTLRVKYLRKGLTLSALYFSEIILFAVIFLTPKGFINSVMDIIDI